MDGVKLAVTNIGIELDGSIHDTQEEYDKWRDQVILEKGIQILRISNQEILEDIEEVKSKILISI